MGRLRHEVGQIALSEAVEEWFANSRWATVVVVVFALMLLATGLDLMLGQPPTSAYDFGASQRDADEGLIRVIASAAVLPVFFIWRYFHNR